MTIRRFPWPGLQSPATSTECIVGATPNRALVCRLPWARHKRRDAGPGRYGGCTRGVYRLSWVALRCRRVDPTQNRAGLTISRSVDLHIGVQGDRRSRPYLRIQAAIGNTVRRPCAALRNATIRSNSAKPGTPFFSVAKCRHSHRHCWPSRPCSGRLKLCLPASPVAPSGCLTSDPAARGGLSRGDPGTGVKRRELLGVARPRAGGEPGGRRARLVIRDLSQTHGRAQASQVESPSGGATSAVRVARSHQAATLTHGHLRLRD